MNENEIISRLGENTSGYFGSVAPPLMQSGNYVFKDFADLCDGIKNEEHRHLYTRGNNPTVKILREKIAALEQCEDALFFSSGAAAVAMAVISQLKTGDHAICIDNVYGWTKKLFADFLPRFGVECSFVDGRDARNFEKAMRKQTRLIFLETPNSHMFELQDIEAVSRIAHVAGASLVVENTYCTPIYQKPADLGADLVVHSSSKYLPGHSDVIAGIVCGSKEMISPLFHNEFMNLGATGSPMDALLCLRGLRTLSIRMKEISRIAAEVIAFLEPHPKIETVIYPFSPDSPQLGLARKQMSGMGGLFSVRLKSKDKNVAKHFCNRLRSFRLGVSWGGFEALALPAAAMAQKQSFTELGLPLNQIRLYTGLEDENRLIEDLDRALQVV